MEVTDAELAKDIFPVDHTGFELRNRRIAAVGAALGAADTETAFGKVQTVAQSSADTVIGHPLNERGIHPALHNKIFQQSAHRVVGKGSHHTGAQAEAAAQTAGNVVFAAAFPSLESSGGMDTAFAGIETEHDFSERKNIITAFFCFFVNGQRHNKHLVN